MLPAGGNHFTRHEGCFGRDRLGISLLGRFEEVIIISSSSVPSTRRDSRSYTHLSSEGEALDADEAQHLAAVLDRHDISIDARITAGFGLGRLLDRLGGMTKRSPVCNRECSGP